METTDKTVEPKPERSEQEKARDFLNDIEAVFEKHQMQLIVQPTFIARDDGTFSVKLITSTGKLPKRE